MMDHRFKKFSIYSIDSYDLNEVIAFHYGLDSFECQIDANNDSVYDIDVDGNMKIEDDEDLVDHLDKECCSIYSLRTVLNDLCKRGDIETGKYLVKVSW